MPGRQLSGIAVAGTVLSDKLNRIRKYPSAGELSKIYAEEKSVGGLVPNVAIDLKRIDFSLNVYAIGRTGNDDDGAFIREKLENEGVLTEFLSKNDGITSHTFVMSDDDGKRTFFTYGGENDEFGYADIPFENLNVKMLHLGYFALLPKTDGGDGVKILKEAKRRGIKTSIDLVSDSEKGYSGVKDCLKYVDNLIINETEAAGLTGLDENDFKGLCYALKNLGVCERVIVHSAKKAAFLGNNSYFEQNSLTLPKGYLKGSTGAGDAFTAGAIYAVFKNFKNEDVLDFAIRAAAVSLSELSATDGMKSADEIYRATEKFKG